MAAYYDVDAILTDAQKAPCTFRDTISGLGYLAGNAGEDLKAGAQAELPYWLGSMLASNKFLELDPPDCLSPRVLNALKADPLSVDIRSQAPRFYGIAAKLLELYDDEELCEVLTNTFKVRAAKIADQAHNTRHVLGEGAEFVRSLDEMEKVLFRAAHDGSNAVKKWIEAAGNA